MTQETFETLTAYMSTPEFVAMLDDIGNALSAKATRDCHMALTNNEIHKATLAAGKAEAWSSLRASFALFAEQYRTKRR